jgi:hypothetical protein
VRSVGVLRCAQDDGKYKATTTAKATATTTAKTNAGVLRCAQNEKCGWMTGVVG